MNNSSDNNANIHLLELRESLDIDDDGIERNLSALIAEVGTPDEASNEAHLRLGMFMVTYASLYPETLSSIIKGFGMAIGDLLSTENPDNPPGLNRQLMNGIELGMLLSSKVAREKRRPRPHADVVDLSAYRTRRHGG